MLLRPCLGKSNMWEMAQHKHIIFTVKHSGGSVIVWGYKNKKCEKVRVVRILKSYILKSSSL